ncbi:adenine deaminase [Saxophila tyrrhenica]|uniref:Adenine deaminase n=1 Tax=Saxophila tyrrhenica TaxID=1690608 RepID=A0AAV9NUU3_9PEZI|nr:adenine deaminase [Saxophila tyrrhenica]
MAADAYSWPGEHHIHIEGALTPELLFQLASSNGVTLPTDDHAFQSVSTLYERYQHFESLDDFLHYYYIGMSVLVTESDFEALAWDYFQHAARDGVVHAEVFFDPQAHLSRGISYETILSGFKTAQTRALEEFGITSELICCFLRHLPVPDSLAAFNIPELQASLTNGSVAGIGLDSSESGFPPLLFKDLYQQAAAFGIRRTAHAGEEGPASYIRDALDTLGVSRVDHGVALVQDRELMARVAEQGTLLTVCPWSNVFLKGVRSVSELPIREFLDAGVQFSINSDDPAYFGNHYILDNFCAVQEAFNLSVDEWRRVCEAGIRGSWCSEQRKAEMLERLERVVAKYEQA